MILIATKTVLNSDSVPQSINLEGSDIKFSNTVRNLGVCLDPTLSFQQQISSVCRICYLELRRISAIRRYLSEDVTKKLLCAFVLSRLYYCNSLSAGCPFGCIFRRAVLLAVSSFYTPKGTEQCCKTHLQNNQICPRQSYASFSSLATY